MEGHCPMCRRYWQEDGAPAGRVCSCGLGLVDGPLPELAALGNRVEDSYDVGLLIREGAYAHVFMATSRNTNEVVAIKRSTERLDVDVYAAREITILRQLRHRNVVRLLQVFQEHDRLDVVLEYVEQTLQAHVRMRAGRLTPAAVKNLSQQLCAGIAFCHAHRIVHRNVDPSNILVDQRRALLKIAGFRLARERSLTPGARTPGTFALVWWRPPEVLLGLKSSCMSVDMWSVGCVIGGDLATGFPLFDGDSQIDTLFKMFAKLGTPTEEEWPGISNLPEFKCTFPRWQHRGWSRIRNLAEQLGDEGIDLLESLVRYCPSRRSLAQQALAHPWFRMVDVTSVE